MKKYIASYQNGKGECWDLTIMAKNYKEARKVARDQRREYGELWSLRLVR